MPRSLALAFMLIACSGDLGSSVRATSVPTATPSPTPSPAVSAGPTVTPAATPAGSLTPIVRPPGALHYVAMGASDTVGIGSLDPANGSWPSRIAALMPPGSTYRNLGVSGSLAAQAQREQLPQALGERPTAVSIWLAVNDLNAQVTAQEHAAAIRGIVDALVQGSSATIFVGNVPDLRAVPAYSGADQAALLAQIGAYNAGVAQAVARQPGRAVLVDLFTGSADLTSQITVSGDGFHPSDAGYLLIAQRFAEAMRKAGVPLRAGP